MLCFIFGLTLLSQQVRDFFFQKDNRYQRDEQLLYRHFIYSMYTRQDKSSGTFFNTIKAIAMWTSQESSILSQLFLRKSRTPRIFLKCSMSYCDVCFCLSKKFFFISLHSLHPLPTLPRISHHQPFL